MQKGLKDIGKIARALGVHDRELERYGRYKAKINLSILKRLLMRPRSKYVLISAITPTSLGEGKTVTTIGLSMALNRLKRPSVCTLRQSSMGPLFGAKGPATGGGRSGVVPPEEINLHFTGDTHAVGAANNLLVSFLENSIFHGNPLGIDPQTITFKRCLDSSDRSLRHIRYGLKSGAHSYDVETGFEITAASEIMSLLTLARDFDDMRLRLKNVAVARTRSGRIVSAQDLKADGMMAAVLKDAIKPNLVQTKEHTPCLIHTGPFANVSVGTSSIVADKIALGLCDYVVTESGFGVDCGAEKFFDIKCRVSGLVPDLCVLVCSARGLKAQSRKFVIQPGGKFPESLFQEDMQALEEGVVNLKKHIENVSHFGIPVIVSLSVFSTDTKAELEFIQKKAREFGARDCVLNTAWKEGSKGALLLAKSVVNFTQKRDNHFRFLYDSGFSIKDKIETVAKKIYGAGSVVYTPQADESIAFCAKQGFSTLPVCIAKTQFSLSHDEALKGAPRDFVFPVKDVRLCSGAGFLLCHASTMQTMAGLPVVPRGEKVDVGLSGEVIGLF